MTLSGTPPKSPSAAATALSFKVCSPAGRSFGKGIRVNSPLKGKDDRRRTPKKSPTFGLGLLRSIVGSVQNFNLCVVNKVNVLMVDDI